MEQAFLQLLQEQQSRLRRICRFYTRDPESEADLYQEICYQLWSSYQRFRGESQPGTWLYRVAVNTAISHVRKSIRQRMTGLAPSHFQLKDSRNPETQILQKEILEQLYQAIHGLKKLDQTLVLLYLEELSYQEIADITGLTENNVGVRLNRIKKKLAQRMPYHP